MNRVVIVGASLAGVSAAEGLRDRGFDGEIHIVGAEPVEPYTRPPLSKDGLAAGLLSKSALALRESGWYANQGIDLHLGRTVTRVDTTGGRVCDDSGTVHAFDGLVIATGCSARALPPHRVAPSVEGFIHTLRPSQTPSGSATGSATVVAWWSSVRDS